MTIVITYINPIMQKCLITYHNSYQAAQGSIGIMTSLGFKVGNIQSYDGLFNGPSFQCRVIKGTPVSWIENPKSRIFKALYNDNHNYK